MNSRDNIYCLFKKIDNNDFFCLLVITAFALIFYFPVIFSDKTISSFDLCYFRDTAFERFRPEHLHRPSNPLLSDPVNQFQPWDIAMLEGVLSFPWLWNPFNGCGSPLLANSQSAVFFPLKYIAYLFGVKKGFGYLCFLKTLCAGVFMYLFLRTLQVGYHARIIGSVGFMFCGFMIVWLQYPLASSALFLPLLFMGTEFAFSGKFKKSLAALASGTAFSFLGGHPETTVHCLTGTFIYALGCSLVRLQALPQQKLRADHGYHKFVPVVVLVLGISLGILIAAVQILPTGEYILNSHTLNYRSTEHNNYSSMLSLSKKHMVNLYKHIVFYLVPDTWGNPSIHDQWWWGHFSKYHETGYIGAGMLFMACVSWAFCRTNKKIPPFLLLQLISLGFIAELPFMQSTIGQIPPFNLAANSRFVLLWSFSGSVLAAIVFDHYWNGGKTLGFGKIWYLFLILLFLALTLFDFFTRFAFNENLNIPHYGLKNIIHFFVFFLPGVALIGISRLSPRNKTIASAIFIIFAGADLYLSHANYNPAIAADQIYVEPQTVKNIKQRIANGRVIPMAQMKPCLGVVYRVNDPRVYDAIDIAWYAAYLENTGYAFPLHEIIPDFNHRFASIASMRYLWIPEGIPSKNIVYYRRIFSDGGSILYENPDALPRAYIASSWQPVATNEEAFQTLNEKKFPWQKRVVIELSVEAGKFMTGLQKDKQFIPAAIISEKTHELTIQLPTGSQGLLVLNDTFYPGWKAFIDGKQAPIYRVNGAFRGVFVRSTDRLVTFNYRPASFIFGLVISFVSLGITVIVLFFKK